jgi:hypothetical protein
MPTSAPTRKSPILAFIDAIHLVFEAIALAEKGLEMNPTKEEERALNETLVKLEVKRAELEAMRDALISQSRRLPGPTAPQVAEVSRLTGEVEALTNASITASRAVALTSRALAVATEIAAA